MLVHLAGNGDCCGVELSFASQLRSKPATAPRCTMVAVPEQFLSPGDLYNRRGLFLMVLTGHGTVFR
jgi:hypothetical protein